jgi:hypothetical protein
MMMVDFEPICKLPWRFLKSLLFGYFWSVLKKMKYYGFEMHTEHAQKTKERIFFLMFAYSLMYTDTNIHEVWRGICFRMH